MSDCNLLSDFFFYGCDVDLYLAYISEENYGITTLMGSFKGQLQNLLGNKEMKMLI